MAILRLRSRSVRRFWFYAALTTLFCAFFVASAAGNLPGSPFDAGDGNLVLNDETADWVNAPNRTVAIDLPTGQGDDSFGQGTKEDTEVPSIVNGSIPNNKSDLSRFYVANQRVGTDDFIYFAWERVQEPSGTTNMDFEFNQSNVLSSNGVTPVRTAGDLLIKYDLSQGGTTPTLGYHLWVTTGNPATVCQASNTVPCWGPVQSLVGAFEGSINTVPVTDPIPPDAPRTLSARTFGEVAVNLSAANIVPPGCGGFGGAYLKSRSSDSFTAALKDFIAPVPVNLNRCVTPPVATQIHDANENVVTQVPLSATVHDRAVVSPVAPNGTPTGTVDFTWYTNGACTGAGTPAGHVTLDANGVAHPSESLGPLAVGDYSFRAHYNGSPPYLPADSPCEPLHVNAATPSAATQIHDAAHNVVTSVPLGTTIHDQATLSGQVNGFAITGTVSFTFYTNGACTGTGEAAGTVVLINGVGHPSESRGPLAAGSYAFRAHYNGDTNYSPSNSPCEPLSINSSSPAVATQIHDAAHNVVTSVPLGTTVHDRALVSGVGGFTPTGTFSFTFYTNGTCTGSGTYAGTVALVNGVGHPSDSRGPLAAGNYSFRATYSGDSNYAGSTSNCEPLTVTRADAATATEIHDAIHNVVFSVLLGTTVHDHFFLTGVPSFQPTGTVSYRFHTNGNCAGTGSDSGTVTLDGGVAPPSTPWNPYAPGNYSFSAAYSGDSNYTPVDNPCERLRVLAVHRPALR